MNIYDELAMLRARLKRKEDMYLGIISALAIVKEHDAETIYHEIVDICNLKELVETAKNNEELEFSGLIYYGYVTKTGKVKIKR